MASWQPSVTASLQRCDMPRDPLTAVEHALDHAFADKDLLMEALTHASYAAEHEGVANYQRLEFLGDAVLELVTTDMIFAAMVGAPEGQMTKVRAAVVDEPTLAAVGRAWGLDRAMRVGVGEERSGGRTRDSIVSDVVESVIAAIYLDAGFSEVERMVRRVWQPIVDERIERSDVADARSRLQEELAKDGATVTFAYDRSGPDHATVFTAHARVDDRIIGTGSGGSKKAAAIAAAHDALQRQ